eukprot:snap_masked-scaffold_71-processed-gene-0.33-mRNA-1 protein AED:1.00 eAED:1.00 QI:0/0/0/0/1/1/2/0/59
MNKTPSKIFNGIKRSVLARLRCFKPSQSLHKVDSDGKRISRLPASDMKESYKVGSEQAS